MMKKRFASFMMVIMLVLGMIVPVHASIGSITINKPAGSSISISGETFYAYRIFDLSYAPPAGQETDGTYAYTLNADFTGLPAFLKSKGIIATADVKDVLTYLRDSGDHSDKLNAFSKAVNNFIALNKSGFTKNPAGSVTIETNAESGVITLQELGYYIVLGNASDNDGNEVIALAALTNNEKDAMVNIKADAPTLEKYVWNDLDHQDVEDETEGWHKSTDANIGDTVKFSLKSYVPKMTGYTAYTFTMYDRMTKGLTFNPSSVKVFMGGTDGVGGTPLDLGTHYKVNVTKVANDNVPDDTTEFNIEFLNFYNYWKDASYAGKEIFVTYEATLNKFAMPGGSVNAPTPSGNINFAYLKYSNNPHSDSTKDTEEVKAWVYTFQLVIDKFAMKDPNGGLEDENKQRLAGAKFKLYRVINGNKEPVYAVLGAESDEDTATYYIAKSTDSGATDTFVTPKGGFIYFEGLDEGVYNLEETEAPAGYNPLDSMVHIEIDAKYDGYEVYGSLEYYYWLLSDPSNKVENEDTKPTVWLNVENKGGTRLPETGGIGRTVFTITGGALMFAAMVLGMSRKKALVKVKK